ncbi:ABC transporter substrate-binding protein [Dactylosporangium darangshiense]|uniref:ABC transporter substrate-binding protein n=1 Tax=Dactylosporangium darangshiense TaxID=579108 RepID=UPI003630D2DC
MRLLPPPKPLTALITAAVLATGLTACGGSSGSSDTSSATSGTINWWGWTPTDTATAEHYIAAFNRQYPNIKVNYKLVNISDWVAALRPALASGKGPDVFDMQPGAYVTQFKSFAEDQTSLAEEALGSDWKSKVAPIGISGLSADGKLTAMSVGSVYAGLLWINANLFAQYKLDPPKTLADWKHVVTCSSRTARAASCRAPRRRASTRTPCSRSPTRCSPACGRRRRPATRSGTTPASSRR